MEGPAQRMFARHRLGLADVCLNELALRHMAQPAADHIPVARRSAEHALHQEGIEIEDDRAADPNQCGSEDDVGCVHHMPLEAGRSIAAAVSAATASASGASDTHSTVSQPCEASRLPSRRMIHGSRLWCRFSTTCSCRAWSSVMATAIN